MHANCEWSLALHKVPHWDIILYDVGKCSKPREKKLGGGDSSEGEFGENANVTYGIQN